MSNMYSPQMEMCDLLCINYLQVLYVEINDFKDVSLAALCWPS